MKKTGNVNTRGNDKKTNKKITIGIRKGEIFLVRNMDAHQSLSFLRGAVSSSRFAEGSP